MQTKVSRKVLCVSRDKLTPEKQTEYDNYLSKLRSIDMTGPVQSLIARKSPEDRPLSMLKNPLLLSDVKEESGVLEQNAENEEMVFPRFSPHRLLLMVDYNYSVDAFAHLYFASDIKKFLSLLPKVEAPELQDGELPSLEFLEKCSGKVRKDSEELWACFEHYILDAIDNFSPEISPLVFKLFQNFLQQTLVYSQWDTV